MAFPSLTRLTQDVVYWAPGAAGDDGQPVMADPIALKCRWEDRVDEIVEAGGTTVQVAHYLITSKLLKTQGWVLLGVLGDLTAEQLADPVAAGAVRVVAKAWTPNVRQTKHFYEAWA